MTHPTEKAIITCALTGVLTNPQQHPVPVTPEEMAAAALEAHQAGASIVHVHFRCQEAGLGHLPSWDPVVASDVVAAIRETVPGLIINMSTGVIGPDISGPTSCLEAVKPEYAACNSGCMNYLKVRRDGSWAWPPMVFDNSVEKIEGYLSAMQKTQTRPEFECFDTGHVRSVGMFAQVGLAPRPSCNFVMGVASGMPLDPAWLPLLIELLPPESLWQVTAIGRQDVWPLHQEAANLGGNLRTGLEDTFYLPDGTKAGSNGELVDALADCARKAGRQIASINEARETLGLSNLVTGS